jgi:hypothetical protein
MHQPAGLIGPSTDEHAFGACHKLQFWQRCPDFGTG